MAEKRCEQCGEPFKGQRLAARFCSKRCSNLSRWPTAIERFWSKVDRRAADECWTWLGSRGSGGYGHIKIDGVVHPAHRVAYCLEYNVPLWTGRSPCVLHECDRGHEGCVNPAHLFLGTQAENVQDMVAKGRQQRGERSGQAKLCACAVRAIRKLAAEGILLKDMANRFGVSITTVGEVTRGASWKHVA